MDQNEPMKYEEIAKVLNIPMKTAHMRSKRALDKAKLILEKRGYKAKDFFGENK